MCTEFFTQKIINSDTRINCVFPTHNCKLNIVPRTTTMQKDILKILYIYQNEMLKKFKQPRGKQEEEKGDIKTIMTKVKKQKGHKMGD